jgi:hypothetical protein
MATPCHSPMALGVEMDSFGVEMISFGDTNVAMFSSQSPLPCLPPPRWSSPVRQGVCRLKHDHRFVREFDFVLEGANFRRLCEGDRREDEGEGGGCHG